jgi:chemotaxis protein MotB
VSADHTNTRIIVKHGHGGHHDDEHGGQWKIAYADFVTAMMAFFLIMWLLNITSDEVKTGIANYFNSTGMVGLPAGNGMLQGGSSVINGGDAPLEQATESAEGGLQSEAEGGIPIPEQQPQEASASTASRSQIERQRFEAMKAEFERMLNARDGELREFAQNVIVEVTHDGLRLQLTDNTGKPLFNPGSAEPTPALARIIAVVGQAISTLPNALILAGHTDATPLGRPNYTNWELSADRANHARRVLERSGVQAGRIFRIDGSAATEPLLAGAPNDPRNRRISLTIMRTDIVEAMKAAARSTAASTRTE